MKELVEIIAKALVDNPDEVVVTETEKDKALVVNLKVAWIVIRIISTDFIDKSTISWRS